MYRSFLIEDVSHDLENLFAVTFANLVGNCFLELLIVQTLAKFTCIVVVRKL